jgi:hypothetical protein
MGSITNIQAYLQTICDSVTGVMSIVVSDREGVTILSACSEDVSTNKETDVVFSTIYTLASEQSKKIEALGSANTILTFYNDNLICQGGHGPLVITLVAEGCPEEGSGSGVTPGELLEIMPDIRKALNPTRDAISQVKFN